MSLGPTRVFSLKVNIIRVSEPKKSVSSSFNCSMKGVEDVRVTYVLHIAVGSTDLSLFRFMVPYIVVILE